MRAIRAIVVGAAMLVGASPAAAAPSALEVLGVVTSAARPVGNALVIALNLQDLATFQTTTGADGRFVLPMLRSGMYKIIAVKQGFAPAVTTILPTRARQRVTLRLQNDRPGGSGEQDIWELRASLPSDVLRELEAMLDPAEPVAETAPRFRGEMMSMTAVGNDVGDPAFARTELGVEGRLAGTWEVGVRGDLQRFDDPTDRVTFGAPVAESSVMSMEVRSAEQDQSYRLASTKSSWLYATPDDDTDREIDVRAHNFEWQRGPARVQVRYFEQENLFRDAPMQSNLLEISGRMPLVRTDRTGLALGVRMTQESVENGDTPFRRADLLADGNVELVPSFIVHYGMAGRIGLEGQEWAPRTGAEWKMTKHASLVGSAQLKVIDREPGAAALPAIVFWTEDSGMLPRYAYSLGFVASSSDGGAQFSAVGSVARIDERLRIVFADREHQFWDGLMVDAGDLRRDLRLAWRKDFGNVIAFALATSAGSAFSSDPAALTRTKTYVAGDLQSTFRPTGTTLVVSYRDIQQPQEGQVEDYRSERLRLRMAQSLYLPIDIKLLLGLELARAENSPYLVDRIDVAGGSRKYIGGLAVNF